MFKTVVKTMPESELISIHDVVDKVKEGKLLVARHNGNWYVLRRDFSELDKYRWYMLFCDMYRGHHGNDLKSFISTMDEIYLVEDIIGLKELMNKVV